MTTEIAIIDHRKLARLGLERLPRIVATAITNYLNNGGTRDRAAAMAAHESERTTKLYDRRDDKVTLDEVERINYRQQG